MEHASIGKKVKRKGSNCKGTVTKVEVREGVLFAYVVAKCWRSWLPLESLTFVE